MSVQIRICIMCTIDTCTFVLLLLYMYDSIYEKCYDNNESDSGCASNYGGENGRCLSKSSSSSLSSLSL